MVDVRPNKFQNAQEVLSGLPRRLSQVYPVRIHGKGSALAMGRGRFGGMTSPLVAGVLIGAGSLMLVWCVVASAMFLASGLTLALAYETCGNLEFVSRGTT